eukprot:scpid93459/ scgid22306/ 
MSYVSVLLHRAHMVFKQPRLLVGCVVLQESATVSKEFLYTYIVFTSFAWHYTPIPIRQHNICQCRIHVTDLVKPCLMNQKFSCMALLWSVTQWEIYDAYTEELEQQKREK